MTGIDIFVAIIVFAVVALWLDKNTKSPEATRPAQTPLTEATELNLYRYNKYQYLQSSQWRTKRTEALARVNFKCQCCSATTDLHVHHITYKNLYNEKPEDLAVLCGDCHTYTHELVGYPQTLSDYETKTYPIPKLKGPSHV